MKACSMPEFANLPLVDRYILKYPTMHSLNSIDDRQKLRAMRKAEWNSKEWR